MEIVCPTNFSLIKFALDVRKSTANDPCSHQIWFIEHQSCNKITIDNQFQGFHSAQPDFFSLPIWSPENPIYSEIWRFLLGLQHFSDSEFLWKRKFCPPKILRQNFWQKFILMFSGTRISNIALAFSHDALIFFIRIYEDVMRKTQCNIRISRHRNI